jgi:hypothetical protein
MWPQMPAQTKFRLFPYLLLIAGLWTLSQAGGLPRPADATEARQPTTTVSGPSRAAKAEIPRSYLRLYRKAGKGETWRTRDGRRYAAWAVLAGVGKVETDHGRLQLPGVRSGLNRWRDSRGRIRRCCAGPMQFNLTDGPPSTWDTFGKGNVYDPADAIPAAGRKLRFQGARRDLDAALLAYNRSGAYVARVKALERRYQHEEVLSSGAQASTGGRTLP